MSAAPMDLDAFERSHLNEHLVDCCSEGRDAGLSALLRANEQYAALLALAKEQHAEIERLRGALQFVERIWPTLRNEDNQTPDISPVLEALEGAK